MQVPTGYLPTCESNQMTPMNRKMTRNCAATAATNGRGWFARIFGAREGYRD